MGLFGGKPATPAPAKPAPAPQRKEGTIRQETWRMNRETQIGKNTIPGTGGKRWKPEQFEDSLSKVAPYGKFGTNLDIHEKIRIMKKLRAADGGHLHDERGRLRREYEENWGLKDGKDY